CAELDGLFAAVKDEDYLAEVFVPALLAADHTEVDARLVKRLQRRGHIAFVHEQSLVRFRDRFAIHLVKRRQVHSAARVELVEWVGDGLRRRSGRRRSGTAHDQTYLSPRCSGRKNSCRSLSICSRPSRLMLTTSSFTSRMPQSSRR